MGTGKQAINQLWNKSFFSKLSSDTISALRFPLMIGIVFIHNEALNEPVVQSLGFREGLPYWLFCIYSLFTNVLPRIGVPLFFLISGYLFFCSGLTKDSYKSKLRRRIKTLLVPYIIWDILAFTYKNFLTGAGTFDFTDAIEIVKIFFIYPQDRPMWYVRNLMFAALVSPIYYVYVKKCRHWGVGLLGIVWIIADDTKGILYSSQIFSTRGVLTMR